MLTAVPPLTSVSFFANAYAAACSKFWIWFGTIARPLTGDLCLPSDQLRPAGPSI
ncbi:hypothetical protein Z949_518 [Sulfitobacter guttiformis KCTC 32187]|nr:hypothetical protein Z949_518 [Sulfitobacter guttiformis KCTC 32187]